MAVRSDRILGGKYHQYRLLVGRSRSVNKHASMIHGIAAISQKQILSGPIIAVILFVLTTVDSHCFNCFGVHFLGVLCRLQCLSLCPQQFVFFFQLLFFQPCLAAGQPQVVCCFRAGCSSFAQPLFNKVYGQGCSIFPNLLPKKRQPKNIRISVSRIGNWKSCGVLPVQTSTSTSF